MMPIYTILKKIRTYTNPLNINPENADITDDEVIRIFKALKEISIVKKTHNKAIKAIVSKYTTLLSVTINLAHNNIGIQTIESMVDTLKSTEFLSITIDLTGNEIEKDALILLAKGIAQTKTFTTINLTGNNIKSSEIEVLAEIIKQAQSPLSLILHHNDITDKDVEKLAKSFKQATVPIFIDLSYNYIENTGIHTLKASALTNKRVTICTQFNNNIESHEVQADKPLNLKNQLKTFTQPLIAERLKKLSQPLKIDLTNKDLTNKDIQTNEIITIFDTLKKVKLQVPVEIKLAHCNTEIKAIKAIADTLKSITFPSITIDLTSNGIGKSKLELLADGLAKIKTSVTIDLTDNNIKIPEIKVLTKIFKQVQSPLSLILHHNDITDKAAQELAKYSTQAQAPLHIDLRCNRILAKCNNIVTNGVQDAKSLTPELTIYELKENKEPEYVIEQKLENKEKISTSIDSKNNEITPALKPINRALAMSATKNNEVMHLPPETSNLNKNFPTSTIIHYNGVPDLTICTTEERIVRAVTKPLAVSLKKSRIQNVLNKYEYKIDISDYGFKKAYTTAIKAVHPDNQKTGNREAFEEIHAICTDESSPKIITQNTCVRTIDKISIGTQSINTGLSAVKTMCNFNSDNSIELVKNVLLLTGMWQSNIPLMLSATSINLAYTIYKGDFTEIVSSVVSMIAVNLAFRTLDVPTLAFSAQIIFTAYNTLTIPFNAYSVYTECFYSEKSDENIKIDNGFHQIQTDLSTCPNVFAGDIIFNHNDILV